MAHHNAEENLHYEPMDHTTCPVCGKAVSSSRPPVYNSTNCCCAQAATYSDGHRTNHHTSPYAQTAHAQDYHVAPSNASTNLSVPSPEGIETQQPNLIQQDAPQVNGNVNGNQRFLQLGPEPSYNLNESQARRSFTFHDNPPYTLQSYLNSPDHYHFTSPSHSYEPSMNGFISQGTHFQAQQSSLMKERSGRSKQGADGRSGQSSWSGEASRWSWELDEMTGVGGWTDDEGNWFCGAGDGEYDSGNEYGYPLDMSGLSE